MPGLTHELDKGVEAASPDFPAESRLESAILLQGRGQPLLGEDVSTVTPVAPSIQEQFNRLLELSGNFLKRPLVFNSIWNMIGQVAPVFVALFTIPPVISQLGNERFGILTLIWMIVGYASVFDFGLSRALTQAVSSRLGENKPEAAAEIAYGGLLVSCGAGVLGGLLMLLLTPVLVQYVFNNAVGYLDEITQALLLAAACLPLLIVTAAIRGVLESYNRFVVINLLRIPLATVNYLGPLLILPFSRNLSVIVFSLVIGRIAIFLGMTVILLRTIPFKPNYLRLQKKRIKPLLHFSGWMTVSNLLSPFMSYMDRFFILKMLSVSVVAFYTTPFEVVIKMMFLPWAILGVIFPRFSADYSQSRQGAYRTYRKTLLGMLLIMAVPILVVIIAAKPALSWWISPAFAEQSSLITQLLAFSVLLSSLSQTASSLIQAAGRSDITAHWHLMEFPLFVGGIFFFIHWFGIVGVALFFMLRTAMDFAYLHWQAQKLTHSESTRYSGVPN